MAIPGGRHLHAHGHRRAVRQVRMAAHHGAERPGDRGEDQEPGSEGVDPPAVGEHGRADQENHPGKASQDAGAFQEGRAASLEEKPAHDDDPERLRGHDDRGDPGGDRLLGPDDAAVSPHEEQEARKGRPSPLPRCRVRGTPQAEEGVEKGSRREEAGPGPQVWGDRLDHHADGEVSRSPYDIKRREGRHDFPGRGLFRHEGFSLSPSFLIAS